MMNRLEEAAWWLKRPLPDEKLHTLRLFVMIAEECPAPQLV
jgi:hypothetical protein